MLCLKNLIGSLAKDGLAYVADSVRTSIPKIKTTKDILSSRLKDLAEDTAPAVEKAHDNVSKMVIDKYSEAVNLTKKAEEQQKKNRARAIRHGIIATSIGFAAGAATGYVLVKKSQIKESDYVFTDDTVSESLPAEKPEEPKPEPEKVVATPSDEKQKTYKEFNDTYQISTDGTTLIKK